MSSIYFINVEHINHEYVIYMFHINYLISLEANYLQE